MSIPEITYDGEYCEDCFSIKHNFDSSLGKFSSSFDTFKE